MRSDGLKQDVVTCLSFLPIVFCCGVQGLKLVKAFGLELGWLWKTRGLSSALGYVRFDLPLLSVVELGSFSKRPGIKPPRLSVQ